MSDDYYGWQPINIPSYGGYSDDYAADRGAQYQPYEPTAWDAVDIERMRDFVRKEDDGSTASLAETWSRAADLLSVTRENLRQHADALNARWDSPAGRFFMSKVGAALHSLDEWQRVASDNASGLTQLADKISKARDDMQELWRQYETEQQRQQRIHDEDKAKITFSDLFGDKHKTPEEVRQDFHKRAKDIAKPLADFYIDVYITKISRGGKYKGPTTEPESFDDSSVPPSRPDGSVRPPSRSDVSGPNHPDLPNRPDLPDSSNPPEVINRPPDGVTVLPPREVPDGPGLAGTAPPIAPPAPVPTPPSPVPPSPPVAPGPPPVVGLPGVRPINPGPGPGPGPRPVLTRPPLPGPGPTPPVTRPPLNRATLPGVGGPPVTGQRGPIPNNATLPGNTGTGRPMDGRLRPSTVNSPTTPPPSNPRLPGATAGSGQRGGPAGPGQRGAPAGRPATPPPSLGGPRGTAPAASPKPSSPLTGKPPAPAASPTGGTRPALDGRAGVARPAPATGPAPSLGGRTAPTTPTPNRAGARKGKPETWEYGDGDDELWHTEASAVGVVEAPAEHRPREQGRSLGQS
ncbi:WXG100 family type VII secretion target [Micromonospora endophytica]|uniref:Uncharacterized protein n=1 Tax=Micromonospora endophytica TaxID=515350 RepID=A0A2W2BWI0_9ACTN|nr:hypothetical protein [Micromonospora endophytica]PZF91655.1 hypothetical protein C1I93_21060 [Micromonospora endophytica]RIW40284.1 hypothetical protein D3H59_29485 [Micromonospora endophytica]BCJ59699.1 hypothetical protein Jiend_31210 [Micromonospora endophytica]